MTDFLFGVTVGGVLGIASTALSCGLWLWNQNRRELGRLGRELRESVRNLERPRQWPNGEHPILTRAREKANEQLRQQVGPEKAAEIIAQVKAWRDSVPEREP